MRDKPGDSKLFEILVAEHATMLNVYLRSLIWDHAAAEDVFQETMMTAWRRLEEFDAGRPFGPWLRGIARNLVMAHLRKQRRAGLICEPAVMERLEEQMEHIQEQPGDNWEEKTAGLRKCVASLPPNYRQVVDLRYFSQVGARELADRLGIQLETVKKRLQRARGLLADCMKSHGLLLEGKP